MDEIEKIKQRKLAEMQAMQNGTQKASEEQEFAAQVAKLEASIKQFMTKEALQRYGTVKIAHPDIALNALAMMTEAIQSGQARKIDEEHLKMLLRAASPKKGINITRK